ncbi:hypothetical protein HMPREF3213_02930 [Heyndrickxia coagulans]|uniref:Uncharacterized protein n=1 Tax=Heyndrickxia coagulans TaxID=1398 RepID=A0A133KGU9_HEYCO|nr:hypothetical protein HMPREF3213_02930 [Heyndrickxia coagulans]
MVSTVPNFWCATCSCISKRNGIFIRTPAGIGPPGSPARHL